MNFNNLSVSELNNIIKNIFESEEMLFNISVVGEISSFKITRGVAYFTIKDEFSSLNCVMFGADKEEKIGDKVKITGNLNYYAKLGKLSFNAYKIEKLGTGDIFKKFMLLKEKLESEGLFDISAKKKIPENVKRIGVVTSSTGAALRDIINVAQRRNNSVDIVVFDTKVQGNNSGAEISKAINFFSDYNVDVIIVARGGGSKEELDSFNEESVVRSCFMCKIPIVSAVGHEVDYTLIDFASDLGAPTPSAAAELVVKEQKDYKSILINNLNQIKLSISFKIKRLVSSLNENKLELSMLAKNRLNKVGFGQNILKHNLINAINLKLKASEFALNELSGKLAENNPKILNEMGYVRIYKDNSLIKNADNLFKGDLISFNLGGKKIVAEIKDKE